MNESSTGSVKTANLSRLVGALAACLCDKKQKFIWHFFNFNSLHDGNPHAYLSSNIFFSNH